jgi:hypothetical protein
MGCPRRVEHRTLVDADRQHERLSHGDRDAAAHARGVSSAGSTASVTCQDEDPSVDSADGFIDIANLSEAITDASITAVQTTSNS